MSDKPQRTTQIDIDKIEKLVIALGQRTAAQNEALTLIGGCLIGIDASLRQLSLASNPAPNYQRQLSEYRNFDWDSIGAMVLKEDEDGVNAVEWNEHVFQRRSPSNKFDAAIWFSRCTGKDSEGNNRYVRLITFKAGNEAEPIAAKAKQAIRA
jgi:hypothetical protein